MSTAPPGNPERLWVDGPGPPPVPPSMSVAVLFLRNQYSGRNQILLVTISGSLLGGSGLRFANSNPWGVTITAIARRTPSGFTCPEDVREAVVSTLTVFVSRRSCWFSCSPGLRGRRTDSGLCLTVWTDVVDGASPLDDVPVAVYPTLVVTVGTEQRRFGWHVTVRRFSRYCH